MTALSDDFNRADSGTPGGSWTQVIALAQLVSNQIVATDPAAMYVHGTSLADVVQYGKWSLAGLADANVNQPYLVFRYTNSSSSFYTVRFNSDTNIVQWRSHTSSADTTGTLIDSGALVIGATATYGVTIEGTGNNTVVRVWDGITGLPSDTVTWNGNTSPNLTFTANPGSPVDTGLVVGWGWTTANPFTMTMDNWFGGDTSPGLLYPAAIKSVNWPAQYDWQPERWDFPLDAIFLFDDLLPGTAPAGAIAGTATLTWAQSGSLTGTGVLAATGTLVFAQSGTLKGTGALAGTDGMVFGQSGALKGAGALAGTAAAVFAQTGSLAGAGALASTATLVFAQTGTLDQPSGAMSGTATLVFAQTGSLTGAGALASSATLIFAQTGSLAAAGALAGSAAAVFAQTGSLAGAGALASTATLVFAQTGSVAGSGILAGTDGMVFGQSGALDQPPGVMAGIAAMVFDQSGVIFNATPVVAGSYSGAMGGGGAGPRDYARERRKDKEFEDEIRRMYRKLVLDESDIAERAEAVTAPVTADVKVVSKKGETNEQHAERAAFTKSARLTIGKISAEMEIAMRLLEEELDQRAENLRRIQLIFQLI